MIKREGDGIALSFQGGYQKALNSDADEIGFGPVIELASRDLLITLNPLFTDQVGPNRDFGWSRLRVWLARRIRLCQALGGGR